jgi:hypothetical protein
MLALWIILVHFTANGVTCMLDWLHIRGHGKPLKYVNRLLLPEFLLQCELCAVNNE